MDRRITYTRTNSFVQQYIYIHSGVMIHYMIWFSNKNLNTTSVRGEGGRRHARHTSLYHKVPRVGSGGRAYVSSFCLGCSLIGWKAPVEERKWRSVIGPMGVRVKGRLVRGCREGYPKACLSGMGLMGVT